MRCPPENGGKKAGSDAVPSIVPVIVPRLVRLIRLVATMALNGNASFWERMRSTGGDSRSVAVVRGQACASGRYALHQTRKLPVN